MNSFMLPPALARLSAVCDRFVVPCVSFSLEPVQGVIPVGTSNLGGAADLPAGFAWPANKSRPLDYLLQVDLAEASRHDSSGLLPRSGLLSFFYDLQEQPWGYDPKDLEGFCVVHTPPNTSLQHRTGPHPDYALQEFRLSFSAGLTLPVLGSRDYERLETSAALTDNERHAYSVFASQLSKGPNQPQGGSRHRLLGHADNIQGDMQLEAQLVTNGLYCGNPSGYSDPRARSLEPGADEWVLLLQLDSDDGSGLMWGDCGRLYYWIRRPDLAVLRFDRVWMTLQCF